MISFSVNAQAKTDTVMAATKDVETVDAIIAALYNVISGPAGEVRNRDAKGIVETIN